MTRYGARSTSAILAALFAASCSSPPPEPSPSPSPAETPEVVESEDVPEPPEPTMMASQPRTEVGGLPIAVPSTLSADQQTGRKIKSYFDEIRRQTEWMSAGFAGARGNPDALPDPRVLETTVERIRRLEVPEPCEDFHRRALEVFDDFIRLAEHARALPHTRDKSTLASYDADLQSAIDRVRELNALARDIKRGYEIN